jgi:hypothetical protein
MATATTLPADKFDTSTTFVRPDPLPNRAPLDKLAVLPGFNTRVKDADYNERVGTIAESIVSHGFFDDKPFAVVMLPNDDTIYIFDGEHRFDGAKQASLDGAEFPEGLPIAWAKDGATVKDLTIHLAHGNNGERLNMVELASVVRRMQGLDMTKEEIAAALGRTTRHVDNLFVLAAANTAVRKAVASGQIAGAEAVKLLRKDKTTAAAKIAEHVAAAVAKGKAKATPKSMTPAEPKPAGPKTKVEKFEHVVGTESVMGELLKSIAGQVRGLVQVGEGDKVTEGFTISIALTVVDHEAEAAAKAAAETKAAAKAEREAAAAAKKAEKDAKKQREAEAKKATDAALKEAVASKAKGTGTKSSVTKPSATKEGGDKKPTAAEAKAAAQAHLGTGEKAAVKPRSRAKAATPAQEPAQSDSGAPATDVAQNTGSGLGGSDTTADGAMTDASMGGL